jgi:nucleoside-diphosphate-sugar epimerase
MRVLVLGGTRFIGPFAVRALVEAGHQVTIFHSGRTEVDVPPSVRHVHGRFENFAAEVGKLRALEPQVVVDMVPFVDKAGHGIAHFLDATERAVVVTSGDVYRAFARLLRSEPGHPDDVPLSEDAPLRAERSPDLTGEIDFDNLEVERAVAALPLPVTVLRPAVVYGPNDPLDRLGDYLRRMDDGRPAILLEEAMAGWRLSREYAGNVGAAIACVVGDDRSAGRVFNVAAERTLTEEEWVRAIAAVVGWRGEIRVVPSSLLPHEMRAGLDLRQDLVLDSSRIRKELDFVAPVAHDEELARTVAWCRRHRRGAVDYAAEDEVLQVLADSNSTAT